MDYGAVEPMISYPVMIVGFIVAILIISLTAEIMAKFEDKREMKNSLDVGAPNEHKKLTYQQHINTKRKVN